MAAMVRGRGPKDVRKTVGQLMRYLGRHKLALAAVAVMVFIGSGANIFGTYLLKPVINRYVLPGDVGGLLTMLLMMGVMYLAGATATWATTSSWPIPASRWWPRSGPTCLPTSRPCPCGTLTPTPTAS